MIAAPLRGVARPSGDGPPRSETGSLSLEFAMLIPAVALVAVLIAVVAVVGRDLLILHEGARAGARAAATTTDDAEVREAVARATAELGGVTVTLVPSARRDGDLVQVVVRVRRTYLGGLTRTHEVSATARVEPGVASAPPRVELGVARGAP